MSRTIREEDFSGTAVTSFRPPNRYFWGCSEYPIPTAKALPHGNKFEYPRRTGTSATSSSGRGRSTSATVKSLVALCV